MYATNMHIYAMIMVNIYLLVANYFAVHTYGTAYVPTCVASAAMEAEHHLPGQWCGEATSSWDALCYIYVSIR